MKVELIDYMGGDLSICNAARVSFEKESSLEDGKIAGRDQKLLNYLAKHKHWTPFAHTSLSFRISAPVYVARQLGKHQVGLVWNEVSRRYVDTTPTFHIPHQWRARADNVKQGSRIESVPKSDQIARNYYLYLETAKELYHCLLEDGVCPEQARMVLPQSMITQWIWTGSLAAFARVCNLRLDSHTQAETREVAREIDSLIRRLGDFHYSWSALTQGENSV